MEVGIRRWWRCPKKRNDVVNLAVLLIQNSLPLDEIHCLGIRFSFKEKLLTNAKSFSKSIQLVFVPNLSAFIFILFTLKYI